MYVSYGITSYKELFIKNKYITEAKTIKHKEIKTTFLLSFLTKASA